MTISLRFMTVNPSTVTEHLRELVKRANPPVYPFLCKFHLLKAVLGYNFNLFKSKFNKKQQVDVSFNIFQHFTNISLRLLSTFRAYFPKKKTQKKRKNETVILRAAQNSCRSNRCNRTALFGS